ncbi:hypothetical protein [Mycolicibacterium celeriflavum]|uniref:Uncharacterized protein n=2 Tax=Mycolicibacterium celeriflavum TaxID=1249101 RepID=A0A1X0C1C4_MYCCF|nr:hypothetical protein [Mycolicibacterium celeriflavum]MCV7239015.1 hypothetical protein [Mycolicibacterium celeriflavum]ORA50440.1 hypothetical protein BST21_04200 [Mycolicibacterium celeriflavum]BBY45255.1 hypothetical protein MCEL_35500 [Mycolicibacterium celeriflavum]
MMSRQTRWQVAVAALVAAAVGAILIIATLSTDSPARDSPARTDLAQPFAEDSPFRTPIPADAEIDPNSAAMIRAVQWENRAYASTVEFGIPIYTADAHTPRYSVPCLIAEWGRCPFDGLEVPIPDDARPQDGSDGAMVVIDPDSRKIYEFWRAKNVNGSWTTEFGAVNDLDGSGWGGASTGSGASRLAGVVRVAEIAQELIPHALAMQSNNVCAKVFRPPALKTDGRSTRPDCIPEGARMQLDPSLDINRLGLTPAQHTVAEALQKYGAYIVDVSASPLSISFERDDTAAPGTIGRTYSAAGIRWDYDGLSKIPWNRLRVLK